MTKNFIFLYHTVNADLIRCIWWYTSTCAARISLSSSVVPTPKWYFSHAIASITSQSVSPASSLNTMRRAVSGNLSSLLLYARSPICTRFVFNLLVSSVVQDILLPLSISYFVICLVQFFLSLFYKPNKSIGFFSRIDNICYYLEEFVQAIWP